MANEKVVNVANNTNMKFTGISRISNIKNAPGKYSGWCVRRTLDKENPDNLKFLELGIWITDEIFLSVPVDFNLRYKFVINSRDEENGWEYCTIPADACFGIKKFTSKETGKEKFYLTEASDKYPRVYIACYAYTSRTLILDATFDDHTKILRKYVDADRTLIGVIAMTEVDGSDIDISVTDGVPNSFSSTVYKTKFKNGSIPTTEEITYRIEDNIKFEQKFISFPMFIEEPKKPRVKKDGEEGEKKEFKKPFNNDHNKKYNNGPKQFNKK